MHAQSAPIEIEGSNDILEFVDERDGQSYEVMLLKDGNYWLSENLNYQIEASWCYDDSLDNCTRYGRLYSWSAAMESCPEGWKLPSDEEWKLLLNTYKYSSVDSIELVTPPSQKRPYWGTEERRNIIKNLIAIGFITGKGGTKEAYGAYINQPLVEQFWTSTSMGQLMAYNYQFRSRYQELKAVISPSFRNKDSGIFCRCVKVE